MASATEVFISPGFSVCQSQLKKMASKAAYQRYANTFQVIPIYNNIREDTLRTSTSLRQVDISNSNSPWQVTSH